ncbi:MAG: AAA family ATPase [Patescibacteria group bacterium]
MAKQLLVIITGPPGTGKTTIGKKIAKRFGFTYLSKDIIKESLFDDLGIKDREWSRKIGSASYSILYRIVEEIMAAGQPLVTDSNFKPEYDQKKFKQLITQYDYCAIEISCRTEGVVLTKRFKKRFKSGERHPGHVDHINLKEFKKVLSQGEMEPLNIGGVKIISVDTTDFKAVNYKNIYASIQKLNSQE